jgi:hypothetical protein
MINEKGDETIIERIREDSKDYWFVEEILNPKKEAYSLSKLDFTIIGGREKRLAGDTCSMVIHLKVHFSENNTYESKYFLWNGIVKEWFIELNDDEEILYTGKNIHKMVLIEKYVLDKEDGHYEL